MCFLVVHASACALSLVGSGPLVGMHRETRHLGSKERMGWQGLESKRGGSGTSNPGIVVLALVRSEICLVLPARHNSSLSESRLALASACAAFDGIGGASHARRLPGSLMASASAASAGEPDGAGESGDAAASMQVELMPHRNLVRVVIHDGKAWIRHDVTRETKQLPEIAEGGRWDLHFDAEERAILVPDVEGETWPLHADDVLEFDAYKSPRGDVMVNGVDGTGYTDLQFLNELSIQYVFKNVKVINFGIVGHDIHIDAAVYALARSDGCRVLWSMPSLFKALHLDGFLGQPARWLHKRWHSWERQLSRFLNDTVSLQRSQQYNEPTVTLDKSRNLPWVAASTVSLLGVTLRLAALPPHKGGVGDDRAREAFQRVLKRLVNAATASGGVILLHFDEDAEVVGAPLFVYGRHPIRVELVAGGRFTIPMCEAETNPRLLRRLLAWSRSPLVGDNLDMVDWLGAAAVHDHTGPLLGQVVGALGRLLEASFFNHELADRDIFFDGDTVSELGHGNIVVESALCRLLEVQRKKCAQDFLFFSIGTDKARIGTHGFQNVLGATPDGVGFLGPPQVALLSFYHIEISWSWKHRIENVSPVPGLETRSGLVLSLNRNYHRG